MKKLFFRTPFKGKNLLAGLLAEKPESTNLKFMGRASARKRFEEGGRKRSRRERFQKGQGKKRGFGRRGQGLIEYLILVALMGVATIGIIRTLNQTVKSRFANAIYALQGRKQKAKTHQLKKGEYQRSDLSNFMSGAASSDDKKSKSNRK